MNGKFLLDTSIIIALFANEPEVRNRISGSEEVFISSVSLGELYFGAYRSSKAQENIDRIDDFALSTTVLNCSTETAKRYGEIKNRLKDKGKPIPENDIWIAALAKQYDLTLVTRDTHFIAIDKLKREAW